MPISTVTRSWLAFAALGTGMIHLALILNAPFGVALILGVVGAGELSWAVLTLIRERIAAPRLVICGAALPVLFFGVLAVVGTAIGVPEIAASLGTTALGLAALLELFVAVTVAVGLRRGRDFAAPSLTPAAGRYLLGLTVGGMIVGALTTPALAATEAGRFAQPHGQHSDSFQPASDPDAPTVLPPTHGGH